MPIIANDVVVVIVFFGKVEEIVHSPIPGRFLYATRVMFCDVRFRSVDHGHSRALLRTRIPECSVHTGAEHGHALPPPMSTESHHVHRGPCRVSAMSTPDTAHPPPLHGYAALRTRWRLGVIAEKRPRVTGQQRRLHHHIGRFLFANVMHFFRWALYAKNKKRDSKFRSRFIRAPENGALVAQQCTEYLIHADLATPLLRQTSNEGRKTTIFARLWRWCQRQRDVSATYCHLDAKVHTCPRLCKHLHRKVKYCMREDMRRERIV